MSGHPFTIASAEESAAFDLRRHENRRARQARFLFAGQRISDELAEYAAEARARIAEIPDECPDTG